MSDLVDPDDPTPAPLPKEKERRIVEDADARGIEVVLQGGETWYVVPMPLTPRGMKIATLIDDVEEDEIELAAARRAVEVWGARLDGAADPEAIAREKTALLAAVAERGVVQRRLEELYRELCWNALRSCYRITVEEAGMLATQRHWPEVLKAVVGKATEKAAREDLYRQLERVERTTGGGRNGAADPTRGARSTSAAGRAPS